MECELGREVHVGEHVAVQDEQPVREQPLVCGQAHRPRGAERIVLAHVAQPHVLVLVAEHVLDRVREKAARQQHVVDAVRAQPVEHESEEWAAGEWHHRLGHGVRERA